MIAAAFPPAGGAGVQRSVKFAKYLPKLGWRPIVWTVEQYVGLPEDETMLHDLPSSVDVHRGRRESLSLKHSTANATSPKLRSLAARAWNGFGRYMMWVSPGSQRGFPDEFSKWAHDSIPPLVELIEMEGIDAIYSTFSPASNHLMGLLLKKRTGLPWVADFRDLWTDDYRYQEKSAVWRAKSRELETEILRSADRVVGVTPSQTKILASRIPSSASKFHTIPNGFDPTDFAHLQQAPNRNRNDKFVLGYIGRLDRWVTKPELFEGIARFACRLNGQQKEFVFRITGHASNDVLQQLIERDIPYCNEGYKSHAEAIEAMQSASALLVCGPHGTNGETTVPGKLYECLGSGMDILCVSMPESECATIVEKCEAGITTLFDAGQIERALCRLHSAWRNGEDIHHRRAHRIDKYTRLNTTKQLADLLDNCVSPPIVREEVFECSLIGIKRSW